MFFDIYLHFEITKREEKQNKTDKGSISQRGLFSQLGQIDHDKPNHLAYKLLPVTNAKSIKLSPLYEHLHSPLQIIKSNILIYAFYSKTTGNLSI